MHLLLVEDDPELAAVLVSGFTEHGHQVVRAESFAAARTRVRLGTFDVIVLDVMLPGGSGTQLCREVRAEGVATPILMLTARDTLDDRVLGLEVGADDYLTKPFATEELVARVRTLLRRAPARRQPVVDVGALRVETA
ncbi:MAG: response regulator transcription factor, partial [Gemmatimonadales bacterium]